MQCAVIDPWCGSEQSLYSEKNNLEFAQGLIICVRTQCSTAANVVRNVLFLRDPSPQLPQAHLERQEHFVSARPVIGYVIGSYFGGNLHNGPAPEKRSGWLSGADVSIPLQTEHFEGSLTVVASSSHLSSYQTMSRHKPISGSTS